VMFIAIIITTTIITIIIIIININSIIIIDEDDRYLYIQCLSSLDHIIYHTSLLLKIIYIYI
jgi:hypothetical protein